MFISRVPHLSRNPEQIGVDCQQVSKKCLEIRQEYYEQL